MVLATSAIHSWLTRKGLRTFCSINVRSSEAVDPHDFAVLIGCGATTVNPYLAQDSIADRIGRCLCPPELPVCACGARATLKKGPVTRPGATEMEANPRSVSARMRAAVRTAEPLERAGGEL